jgi:GxxExxY protein
MSNDHREAPPEAVGASRFVLERRTLTREILGCFFETYNGLGHGFLESVYESALAISLQGVGLQFTRQAPIEVWYRGQVVGDFKADILVDNAVILELKVAKSLDAVHMAQLLNYLTATTVEVGFLLNFGVKPEFKRVVLSHRHKNSARFRENPRFNPAGA